jgi:hypothetical protein
LNAYTTFLETQQATIAISNITFDADLGPVTITYDIIPPTTLISNICFPAGTPVKTDQGLIPIEQINKQTHTIAGQVIKHITKTVTLDKYLIRFERNSIGCNMPSATTVMTQDHKILFQGQLVPAYRFLKMSNKVIKVKYSGEVLYNVLLASYTTVTINNLSCETLHPENMIAKLYTNNYTNEERQNIIFQLNKNLGNKNFENYKNIVHQLTYSTK